MSTMRQEGELWSLRRYPVKGKFFLLSIAIARSIHSAAVSHLMCTGAPWVLVHWWGDGNRTETSSSSSLFKFGPRTTSWEGGATPIVALRYGLGARSWTSTFAFSSMRITLLDISCCLDPVEWATHAAVQTSRDILQTKFL